MAEKFHDKIIGQDEFRSHPSEGPSVVRIQHTIANKDGIHARPAGYLSNVARKFSDRCHIFLRKETEDSGRCCDASSILSVMGENFKCGDNIFLQVVFNDNREENEDVILELNNILEEHF